MTDDGVENLYLAPLRSTRDQLGVIDKVLFVSLMGLLPISCAALNKSLKFLTFSFLISEVKKCEELVYL